MGSIEVKLFCYNNYKGKNGTRECRQEAKLESVRFIYSVYKGAKVT